MFGYVLYHPVQVSDVSVGGVWSVWQSVWIINATFNTISAISWRSVLLVEETRVPGENHWHSLSHNVVSSTPYQVRQWNLNKLESCVNRPLNLVPLNIKSFPYWMWMPVQFNQNIFTLLISLKRKSAGIFMQKFNHRGD